MFGALATIPWLTSICTFLLWIGRALWQLFGRAARNVALWFSTFVPWVLANAAKRLAFRAAVLLFVVGLLTAIWSLVLGLVARVVSYSLPDFGDLGGTVVLMAWDYPFALGYFYQTVLPGLLGLLSAAWTIRVAIMRFMWAWRTSMTR